MFEYFILQIPVIARSHEYSSIYLQKTIVLPEFKPNYQNFLLLWQVILCASFLFFFSSPLMLLRSFLIPWSWPKARIFLVLEILIFFLFCFFQNYMETMSFMGKKVRNTCTFCFCNRVFHYSSYIFLMSSLCEFDILSCVCVLILDDSKWIQIIMISKPLIKHFVISKMWCIRHFSKASFEVELWNRRVVSVIFSLEK